jgi:tight adherence protein B
MPLALGGCELFNQVLLAAFGSTVLLGCALFRVIRAERRRARIGPRLKAIALTVSGADRLVVSLRRPRPQGKALPAALVSRLDLAFAATGNRIGPLHLAAAGFGAAAMIGLVGTMAQFRPAFAVALGGAAAVGAPVMLLQFAQSRYQRQFLDIFADALDLIVRAVRAGLPAPEAIEAVTREVRPPVSTEFQRMLDEMRIGTGMEDALQNAADRIRVPDFRFFVVSLLLQRQTGGGIAEILSNLSTIIRQRKALRSKARALTAEAQASAAIVASTPFVAGVGLFFINRELMSVLFVDPRGRFMLGLAVFGLLSGLAAMRALIKMHLRRPTRYKVFLLSVSARCSSTRAVAASSFWRWGRPCCRPSISGG